MECPACRASVLEGSRFCPSCGHALAIRAEERRVVTVLFADLVGFTGLAEGVDPEQVKNLVDGAFQRLVTDIANHGGRVDKIVGDQIIALFGAPVAHEDDAERAVRAALQMHRTLDTYASEIGVPVQMRIGVNTGEVLVGALRAGGEYTAMGDTVNVASRLQTTAQPGQVLVGQVTNQQTDDVVRYQAVGLVHVRGREEPVDAFSAEATLAPPGQRRSRTRTPLVGREQEMSILSAAVGMAFERRRPQFVVISGEAGVGKSRLSEEVTQRAGLEHGATVLEGRCVPYGEANVWWPMAAAVRQAFNIGIDDTAEQAEDKCREMVAWGLNLPADHPNVQRATEGLSYLLGIPTSLSDLEPSRARERALRSLIGLFQNLAAKKPLVLAISDLHWADDLVLDLLDRLPDRMRGLPFAIVATARPELTERWAPKSGRHNLVSLHLDPLDRTAAEFLLTSLLEGAPSPALAAAVLDRSGGNPFFLEELAALVHQEGSEGELPATLRALIATRLDNLPPDERRVLGHAAVVGRLGSVEALAALGGPVDAALHRALEALVGRDLLGLNGGQWDFRSDLVREVVYETLTKGERARNHAQLGAFLSAQARERGREAEQMEALAHHYGVAAELAAELGHVDGIAPDVVDQALTWIERSVSQAELREIPSEAERLSTRALALLPDGPGALRRRFLVRRAKARTVLRQFDAARADVSTALTEAEAERDRWAGAAALTVRGHIEQTEGALHDSAASLDRAIARWQELGDRAGEADARRLRGMTDLFLGHLTSAEANIGEALELFKQLDDLRGQAWAQQNMAWISTNRRDTEEANRRIAESVRLFEEIGDLAGLGWAYGLMGWVRLQQGFLEEADEIAVRVLNDYESGGDRWAEAMMRLLLASTRLWLGRTDEAVRWATEARDHFAAINDSTGELRSVATLSRALLAAGELKQSRDLLTAASAMAERELDPDSRELGRLIAAGVAVQLGETSAFDLGELLEPPSPAATGADRQVPRAIALLQLGRGEMAVTVLDDSFTSASDPGLQQAAGSALAFAHAAAGDTSGALAIAEKVEGFDHGTYLDRINVRFARGFAYVRMRKPDEARRELAEAVALADATGDRLNQALTRLAQARGLEAIGDDDAFDILAVAEERLTRLGLHNTGWDSVFLRAAGIN